MRPNSIASLVLLALICSLLVFTTSPISIAFATTQTDNEDDKQRSDDEASSNDNKEDDTRKSDEGDTSSQDEFGIDEIYPSGGPEWYLDEEDPEGDGIFYHGSLKKLNIEDKGDGVWGVDARTGSPKHGVRLHVDSSDGSWKNVEMTGYIRFVEGANDQFSWLARNGQYHTNGGCDATGYYGILSYDGSVYFLKKTYHYGGGYTDRAAVKQGVVDDLQDGRWIGMKFMAYNIGENNVKLELWLDDSDEGNNWTKVTEYQDNGQWNTQEMHCDRPQNYVVADATERVTFRVDDTKFEFKSLSVREIDAGSGDLGQEEDENEDTSRDREEQEENDEEESKNERAAETRAKEDSDEQPQANDEGQEGQKDEEPPEDSEKEANDDTEGEEQKDSDEDDSEGVTAPKDSDTGDSEEEEPEANDESSNTVDNDESVTSEETDDGSAASEEQDDGSEVDEEKEDDEITPSNDQDNGSLEGSEETSSDSSIGSNENEGGGEENTSAEESSSEEVEDEDTEATEEDTDDTEQENTEVNGEEEAAEEDL